MMIKRDKVKLKTTKMYSKTNNRLTNKCVFVEIKKNTKIIEIIRTLHKEEDLDKL